MNAQSSGSVVGMLGIKISKKTWMVGGSAVISLIAFGLIFAKITASDFSDQQKLQLAAKWLDNGRWDLAGGMAQELESSMDTDASSIWHYVSGTSQLIRIIDDLDSYQNRIILSDVTGHLEKSRELGFPLGYRGKGHFYLGVCLFNTYRWDEAIESLNRSLTEYPEVRSESLRMIISAHLRKPIPDPKEAQAVLEKWLQMPGLSQREIAQTLIAHVQLALQRNRPQDCHQWLAQIRPGIPEHYEGLKWKALSLMQQSLLAAKDSTARSDFLGEAQSLLLQLIVSADTPAQVRRQAHYLSGKVLRYQGRYREAVSVFSGVRQQNPFSAEAIAASLEEAEILMDLERWIEVPSATSQLLSGISDIRLYNEYWLPADELRTRLMEIGNRLRLKEKYELALELSDQLLIAFPANHALRLQANTLASWGFALERESAPDDLKAKQIVADMFARAGEQCEQLAQLEMRSRDYLNIVWTAVEYYQKAGRIAAANRMLEVYLKFESRSKQPRALLAMGKNYIAEGEWQTSLNPLQQCLTDFPSSPSSYEARLLAARALTEMNELNRAIELLSANLWDFELHPDSPVWKESFIELGDLLFQRGQNLLTEVQNDPKMPWEQAEPKLQQSHQELKHAADHLSEAVRRYPDEPRHYYTRYQMARAYQLAAQLPQQTIQSGQSLSDSSRRMLAQQKNQLLERSAAEYGSLYQSILSQSASTQSNSLEPSILRNAYFGQADVLSELGRYQEAIDAYRSAAAYYSNRPEALEALAQIADCYRKMGREEDAQKTIRQAELVLQRIPADRDPTFVTTTRGDRAHWEKTLGRLKEWN